MQVPRNSLSSQAWRENDDGSRQCRVINFVAAVDVWQSLLHSELHKWVDQISKHPAILGQSALLRAIPPTGVHKARTSGRNRECKPLQNSAPATGSPYPFRSYDTTTGVCQRGAEGERPKSANLLFEQAHATRLQGDLVVLLPQLRLLFLLSLVP